MTILVYDPSVGLAIFSPATRRALGYRGLASHNIYKILRHRVVLCTLVCCAMPTNDDEKEYLDLLNFAVYHFKPCRAPARCSDP